MELIDITPEDSVTTVYIEKLTAQEQADRDTDFAEIKADIQSRYAKEIAKEEDKISGINKLIALGLTEDEAKVLTNYI